MTRIRTAYDTFWMSDPIDDEVIVEEVDAVNDALEQWQYGSLVPVTEASEPIYLDEAVRKDWIAQQCTAEGDPDLWFMAFFVWRHWGFRTDFVI